VPPEKIAALEVVASAKKLGLVEEAFRHLNLSSAVFLGVSLEKRLYWAEIVASNN
jgi:hypothetical protein